jgi:hypothetical protein
MDVASWIAIVVAAWVTLSILLGLIVGRIAKYGGQQVPAMGPGQAAGPAPGKRTTVWRSTVAADGEVHHRQVA